MGKLPPAAACSVAALLLAVSALLWLAFWPYYYQGVSLSQQAPADQSGGAGLIGNGQKGEPIPLTASESFHRSLIQENGLRIVWLLIIPVAFSIVGNLGLFLHYRGSSTLGRVLL